MGAGGVVVPPQGYFPKIMEVCRRHDVLMIADEVICGFGRLGAMWGSEVLKFQPHAITAAKALSSAYLPIGAVMIPEIMYAAMVAESQKIGTFGHGFTYSGHPVAAAVAVKTLEIYARERMVEKVARKAPQFQALLLGLTEHPLVGQARGLGLIGGLELVADKTSKQTFDPKSGVGPRVVKFAEEEGLIVRALAGDVISLCPPLVISPEEIGELFVRLTRALDRTLDWATRERLIKS
jgi:4-aminobutyrate--pyruvate transaminase